VNEWPITDPQIRDYYDALNGQTRDCLLELRALAYGVAVADPRIGPLDESLKWSQPSYAPSTPGVGTAFRFGEFDAQHVAVFVHCQTTLVSGWRERLPHLTYSKTRALLLDPRAPVPSAELEQCMGDALTYKLRHT
jgi:hypothetical protein